MLLISACRLVMLYICGKFREIISNGIKAIEWTQFLYDKIQREKFRKNAAEASVVNLCTSSGHALYLCQV